MSHSQRRRSRRHAFTMIELLVVIGVIGVLVALLLPAVQKVRESANRLQCTNNLKQIGLALHSFHDANGFFPPGLGALKDGQNNSGDAYAFTSPDSLRIHSWMSHILPFLEQGNLYQNLPLNPSDPFYSDLFNVPINNLGNTPLASYTCPSDPRAGNNFGGGGGQQLDGPFDPAGLTSYVGVGGVDSWDYNWPVEGGVLYWRSCVRMGDVKDGLSNTLAVGERPPSPDLGFGWWESLDTINDFFIAGDNPYIWEYDTVQYTSNSYGSPYFQDAAGNPCPFPAFYQPGRVDNVCDFNHFWSFHAGGAHFVFVDASVRFLSYSARPVIDALATRDGGEHVDPSSY